MDRHTESRLALLMSDIQEMRPFLVHNFKPENVAIEVADSLVVSWLWAHGRAAGVVPVAPSVEAIQTQLRTRITPVLLSVLSNGLLACHSMPWITSDKQLNICPGALRANLRILEAIHARLWSFYEKVDIDSVLARFRVRAGASGTTEPTDDEVAASCQSIAEPVDQEDSVPGGPVARVNAVRIQRLLRVLSDGLGCEVRQRDCGIPPWGSSLSSGSPQEELVRAEHGNQELA